MAHFRGVSTQETEQKQKKDVFLMRFHLRVFLPEKLFCFYLRNKEVSRVETSKKFLPQKHLRNTSFWKNNMICFFEETEQKQVAKIICFYRRNTVILAPPKNRGANVHGALK